MFGMMEAMLGFIRRQVGLRTDVADSTGSLHAKSTYIKDKADSLNNLGAWAKEVTPSDNIKISADTERYKSGTTPLYKMIKSARLNVDGIVRATFEHKVNSAGQSSQVDVFRSKGHYAAGDIAATPTLEQGFYPVFSAQNTTTSYVQQTVDIPVSSGDSIFLFTRTTSSYVSYVKNFRVKYDVASVITNGSILVD